jgi:hypothetical protein
MARIHHEDDLPVPERYDGAFRCTLCPDHSPREDNDWCPVAGGVVCEDCCRALMMGDDRLLEAVSVRKGHEVDPDDVIAHCMECERLVRLVSEQTFEEGTDARLPMH